MTQPTYRIEPGNWDQLGAVFVPGGVNFSILSRYAERAELLLFDREEATTPFQVVTLDPRINHTFFFWHCLVRDLPSGTWYNWRVDGGRDTRESGSRIDPGKALLDPRAISVSDQAERRRSQSSIPFNAPRGGGVIQAAKFPAHRR